MRKLFSLAGLFVFAISSFSQVHFKKTFYKGDSVYVYPYPYYSWSYYENPEKESSNGLFISSLSLPEGKWIAYYNSTELVSRVEPAAKLAIEFYCKNGKLDGPATVFGRSGKVIARGNYKAGDKDGTWFIYTAKGKYLVEKLNYKRGVPEGDWEFYFQGKLKSRLHYLNGKLEGEQSSWYPNGQIKEVATYKDGLADGAARTYYRNGNKATECDFDGYVYIGWYREWSKKGTLIEETHYFDPREQKPGDTTTGISSFTKDFLRNIHASISYIDFSFTEDGLSSTWYENGQLKNKSMFKGGKKIYGDTLYDEKGKISSIHKDSIATPQKISISIDCEFDKKGHLISRYFQWPDSLNISEEFTQEGLLVNYVKDQAYPVPPLLTKYDSIVIPIPPEFITVESFNKNKKGIITFESHLDFANQKSTEIERSDEGLLISQNIQDKRSYQSFEYDKKGFLKEASYLSSSENRSAGFYDWGGESESPGKFGYRFLKDSSVSFMDNKPREGFVRLKEDENSYSEGNLKSGRHTGHWKAYLRYKSPRHYYLAEESDYTNNQLEGVRLTYKYIKDDYQMYGRQKPFSYLSSKEEYHNGKLNGIVTDYNAYGSVNETTEFRDHVRNGRNCTFFRNGQMLTLKNYKNGILEGNAKQWTPTGTLISDRYYTEGKKDSLLLSWYENGIKEMEGKYMMGRKVGDWIHYYKNGVVKANVHFLTEPEALEHLKELHLNPKKLRKERPYNFSSTSDELPETDVLNGNLEEHNAHLIYYYENTIKAQEGDIYDGMRIGTWTWWREDGSKEKEVDYTSGDYIPGPGDTVHYRGKYTSWYASGKKSLEALIMDEEKKYDCSKEVLDNVQNLYYLNGWNEEGKAVIVSGTGYYKAIGIGGIVRSEGGVAGGVKQGLWSYRDENGNLTATGEYDQGYEEGKWLRGDLVGVHSLENACFRDADPKVLENLMKQLEVEETWYHHGDPWKTRIQTNKMHYYETKERFHPNRQNGYDSFRILPNSRRHRQWGSKF